MSELRGRPLGWVAVILTAWVGARMAASEPEAVFLSSPVASRAMAAVNPATDVTSAKHTQVILKSVRLRPATRRTHPKPFRLHPALDPWQDRGRLSGSPYSVLVAGSGEPMSTGRDTPPSNAHALVGKAGQPDFGRPDFTKRWGGNVYAYSFWRFATGGSAALAPGAQYGGSQSGLIGTVDPFGSPDRGLALLLRGSATPDGEDREAAFGLRWTPAANWPMTLTAERRFRANAPDRFAAYLAGGVDGVLLVKGWKLDAYGQAGYATGLEGGGFFDAQARVTRPVTEFEGIPLSIGAGGWGGGQRGATRLDVGPTATAKVETGLATLLVQLDWRLRVAGNAAPKDGLALTVSTGF